MSDVMVFDDASALGAHLAEEIAAGIVEAGAAGRRYLLGCPGGRSPRRTYAALVDLVAQRSLDLSHVVIVMMDDYVERHGASFRRVDPTLHYSVERFAREEIVGPLTAAAPAGCGIRPDHLWIPDPADPHSYDVRLAEAGGIDLFILASGDTDGHVAFNPQGSARDSRTRVIELAESTRRDNLGTFPEFVQLADVPHFGISIGIATVAEFSRRAVLVAPGPSKIEAVGRIARADDYDPEWPATVLVSCRDASLYADRSSADGLPEAIFEHVHLPERASTGRNEVRT